MTKLEAERRRRGWSQMALGFYANCAQGEISKFEHRHVVPRASQAERLGRLLGLDPAELQDDAPEVEPHA